MARADASFRIPAEIVVGAFVAAGALPLGRLFVAGPVAPLLIGTIALSGTFAWLLRRSRIIAPAGALISALLWFWFAGLLFFRGKTLLLLPTPGMFLAVARAIADGISATRIEVAPIPALTSILVLISLLVWAAAWLADDAVHKLRHPLLAIGFVLPLFVFPGTILDSPHRILDIGLFLVTALGVLFVDEATRLSRWGRMAGGGRTRWRAGLAMRIGVAVTALAIVLAPFVPGYGAPPGGAASQSGNAFGGGGRVSLNPLVAIRPRLNQNPVVPLFSVTSPQPSYWRLTALGSFTGEFWIPLSNAQSLSVSGASSDVSFSHSKAMRQQISIAGLGGAWLPAAYEPLQILGRDGVRLAPESRTLISSTPIHEGEHYSVESQVPAPTAEQLNSIASIPADAMPVYLRLPPTPASVKAVARSWTEGASTPFERAVAIQNNLRRFTYDENVKAGHDFSTLTEFLTRTKRGYCEQFAGSMAVLARLAGIPSRVAIGFSTGNFVTDHFEITSKHAHAWVELWFPGNGWLPFEPTPRGDGTVIVPSYTQSTSPGSSPSASTTTNPSPTASQSVGAPHPKKNPTDTAATDSRGSKGKASAWLVSFLIVIAALLLAAVLLPGASLAKRRIRHQRAGPSPRKIIAAHYLDFLDWCSAVGIPRQPAETPHEYAVRLATAMEPAGSSVRALTSLTTQALWSDGETDGGSATSAGELGRQARRAIALTLPIRAKLLPALGWGWWRR